MMNAIYLILPTDSFLLFLFKAISKKTSTMRTMQEKNNVVRENVKEYAFTNKLIKNFILYLVVCFFASKKNINQT